jgi:hypothetical protein
MSPLWGFRQALKGRNTTYSPGQRPGKMPTTKHSALKGRPKRMKHSLLAQQQIETFNLNQYKPRGPRGARGTYSENSRFFSLCSPCALWLNILVIRRKRKCRCRSNKNRQMPVNIRRAAFSPDFNSRRWSIGSCIPTLERGNDQTPTHIEMRAPDRRLESGEADMFPGRAGRPHPGASGGLCPERRAGTPPRLIKLCAPRYACRQKMAEYAGQWRSISAKPFPREQ